MKNLSHLLSVLFVCSATLFTTTQAYATGTDNAGYSNPQPTVYSNVPGYTSPYNLLTPGLTNNSDNTGTNTSTLGTTLLNSNSNTNTATNIPTPTDNSYGMPNTGTGYPSSLDNTSKPNGSGYPGLNNTATQPGDKSDNNTDAAFTDHNPLDPRLPINNGLLFLLITGMAGGIFILRKKLQPQA